MRYKRVLGLALLIACMAASAHAVYMVHEFYLPLPESQVLQCFKSLAVKKGVKPRIESVTSIVVTGPDTIIHYDHWEDGYETDINNPTQPTTEIWGDGNDSNGITPGFASDPLGLPMGTVISLRNEVRLPRNPGVLLYDGRDRITASKALAVSRAFWPVLTGSMLAEAVEVTATIEHGLHYVAPIGQDVSVNSMFEYVGLAVMADMDNTVVTIDKDGPGGAAPVTVTLNCGESYYVNGGVMKGAEITASKPVQAHLLTGDIDADYETRWYTLFPVESWYSQYMTPVGSSEKGQVTYIFLYNHGAEPITVEATSRVCTDTLTVDPGEIVRWEVPLGSGAMLSSTGGEPFAALATVGANPNATASYDWGFSLVPQDALSTLAVVGWGPGSSDMTRNGSPVWVAPSTATTIYVDFDGDGQGAYTAPNGEKYDVSYDLVALESKTIFDPDGDQTAMRIFTTDGALFTAAWGQDPSVATSGNPYLDAGTTVLPIPQPKIYKSARLVYDPDNDGPSPNDVLEYRIEIDNKGLLPLGNTVVMDTLPSQLSYNTGSTTLDGEALADDTTGTPFPLDEAGYTIPLILRSGTSVFTYQATIVGSGSIVNHASIPQYDAYAETDAEVVPPAGSNPCAVDFVDENGTPVEIYPEGGNIYLRFTDLDANRDPGVAETITLLVCNQTTGDYEPVTLRETGPDSGIFVSVNPLPSSPTSGMNPEDGTLYARAGDQLAVRYTDPLYGDSCSDTATLSVPSNTKQLYLTETAGGSATAMDRIDPVNAGDTTTSRSGIIEVVSGDWLYRRKLTFSNIGRTTTDLVDFPVLVHLTAANFDFAKARSDGGDIRFFDADGTALSYEIETWNATANEAFVWVKVPQIDAGSNSDYIWMHYGNSSATHAQNPAGVWSSNFTAVWHMDETTGTVVGDSTGNGWNGTPDSRVTLNAAGKINGADEYSGALNCRTALPTGKLVDNSATDPFTFEAWVYVETAAANRSSIFAQSVVNDSDVHVWWYDGKIHVGRHYGTRPSNVNQYPPADTAIGVAREQWVHITWVYDGTTSTMYRNGVQGSVSTTSLISMSNVNSIGALNSSTHRFDGKLDEMRISGVARSADWISAQYDAMTDAFITYGIEQPVPSGDTNSIAFTQTPVFASDFTMPAGGETSVSIYVEPTTGTMAGNPFISAVLKSGGTAFATFTALPTATADTRPGSDGVYKLDWQSIALSSNVTISAGEAITLEITSNDSTPFRILYDSQTYPSKVSLPAKTIIKVDSLAIYDAPHPGGSPVDTVVSGSPVYVRATVSDPFGAYDITSLDLEIPEAGVDVTLDDTSVVATTSGTKTYEYAWTAPAEGVFRASVTAHEGSEGVADVAMTPLNVTFLDSGTPSVTEFTISNNGSATNIYDPDQTVYIRVTDLDQNTDPGVAETITVTVTTSTGDTETITLTETGPDTGVFTAEVPASSTSAGTAGDGTLHAPPGTVLDVVYVDQFDPDDTSSDTAIVTQPPGTPDTPALSVRKQLADPAAATVAIGDFVVYRIRVSNTGNVALDPVSLTDTYPGQLQFISAEPAYTTHDPTGRQLSWSNADPLAVGGYREFELTFKALAATVQAINTATAASGGISDSDTAAVRIVRAGQTVTKTLVSAKNPASYGDVVEYRIVVANTGTTRITTLPLEDTFSAAYLEYIPGSATITPDGVGAGSIFWANIAPSGGLAVGGSIMIDLKFKVVGAGTPVVNTATADYSEDEYGNPVPPAEDTNTNLVTTAGLISGHVWNDANQNNTGDAGESRITGVTIMLYDGEGNLVATTTTTGENGYYEFPNLPDGNYTVVETDPPGFTSSSSGNQITVTVANGSVHTNQDFFDYRMPVSDYASISGTVWHDENRNGTNDLGEAGIRSVTVVLYEDVNGDGVLDAGDRAVRQTQTDVNGTYAFTGLPAGKYIVVESDPPGYTSTGDVAGPNDNHIPVEVAAGDKVTGRDFFDARSGKIDGHVWQDLNGDGVFDEADKAAGLEGVTVTLKTNGVVVATTTTAADGSYSFDNLPPGDYEIIQTDLPDWSSTMDSDGTNDNSIVVSLPDGGRSANNNFLDTLPAMLKGFVFVDNDNNLLRAKGDSPVTNALVRLMVDGVVVASTNTDITGYYEFDDVPPGVVSVLVSRVNATLADVPGESHSAYGDQRRNRAVESGLEDAVIVHTVAAGEGVLAERPAETLNFGFLEHPLSTAIDIRLHATPEGVTIQLSTVDEAGCGDIVIYAWIDGGWVEVGRVPAWLVVGEGANTYSVAADGLAAGGAYYFKVIDEIGNLHLSSGPVAVGSLQVEAVKLDLQYVTLRFNTEPSRRYQVEVSTDLVSWRTEVVSAPTAKGWTPFATEPFMAGPGTHTEVRVPRNGRARAFFKIKRVE